MTWLNSPRTILGSRPSGQRSPVRRLSAEKQDLPADVRDAYRRLSSFTRITAGWKVASMVKVPRLTMEVVKKYLLFSHVHDVELNEWEGGTHFYFVRAKCWPSQDTSKSAHKCIVCVDREEPKIYGAYCRCVSGLGEACSHVAALLFALEDFCARGYRSLQGTTVTEKNCKWSRPSAQKVDPVPMAAMRLEKAGPRGRKRKRWSRTGISRVDTRHHSDYEVDEEQHCVHDVLFH